MRAQVLAVIGLLSVLAAAAPAAAFQASTSCICERSPPGRLELAQLILLPKYSARYLPKPVVPVLTPGGDLDLSENGNINLEVVL